MTIDAAAAPGAVDTPSVERSTSSPTRSGRRGAVTSKVRRPVVLDRARRSISVVTRTGWFFVVLTIVSWLVGWRLGWLEFTYLATAGLALFVLAVPFVLGRSRLLVDVDLRPQRVTVGDRASGALTISNPTARRSLPQRVELIVGAGAAEFTVPSLGGGEHHEELFVLPTERRAVIPVGPATLVRDDPLGVLRRSAARTTPILLYVHPRTVPLADLGAGLLRDLEGQPTADLSPSDIAFHALRDYEPGDDRRFVHWLTTARTGRLMVRQFTDTRRAHLAIVLDGAKDAYSPDDSPSGEFETAVSVAASVSVRALSDGQDVTMWACGRRHPALGARTMLDGLAAVTQRGRHSQLPGDVDALVRSAAGVSTALVITGSTPSTADIRAISIRFPVDVRTTVVRVAQGEPPGFRPIGSTMVMTISDLSQLAHLLRLVTKS